HFSPSTTTTRSWATSAIPSPMGMATMNVRLRKPVESRRISSLFPLSWDRPGIREALSGIAKSTEGKDEIFAASEYAPTTDLGAKKVSTTISARPPTAMMVSLIRIHLEKAKSFFQLRTHNRGRYADST